ncbi:uncharacterized protein LOC135840283 [Planococcus citri]|uniref:uncharacterized protein LOC135840283 n=1 Tax=Planococcus citri TaxID=170843 RepID=UPI0031F7B826
MSSTDNCAKTMVTRRVTWNPEETKILISLVGKRSTQNGKLTNAETYQQVSEQMLRLGHKKTPDQCKIKWKHLKNFYYEARKKMTDQERYTICPFYKEIRNAVGSPTSSIFNNRRSANQKQTIKTKQRSIRADKGFANTLYESQQQNGKFNEPAVNTFSSIETAKFPARNLRNISSSVTVSPCSPVEAEKVVNSNSSARSKQFNKSQPLDIDKDYGGQKNLGEFQHNEHDSFLSLYSSNLLATSSNPTSQNCQDCKDNDYTGKETSSPTYSLDSLRTNRSTYSPEVCIKWNSYQINMQNTLPLLLDGDKFVDVTLACEGKFLKCHKLILSACSIYFDELLSQATSQYPIIFMKDMKFWQIQAIIEFMYRGEVNIAQERLSSLLAAAEALRVKGLAAPSNHASNPIDSPKLYSSVKRNRKRKHHTTCEGSDNKLHNVYQEAVDMSRMSKNQNFPAVNNQCDGSDEERPYFKSDQFSASDKEPESESSCITTIILPDHNYQQNNSCKLPEYNHDQYENNLSKNDHYETGHNDDLQTECKNHHDHMYSKPQDIRNQQCTLTELETNEECTNIHDNTIFYSYLSIDDSSSSKA